MTLFPHDHPVASLRGTPRPTPGRARKAARHRMAFLEVKILERDAAGEPSTLERQELAGLAVLHDLAVSPPRQPRVYHCEGCEDHEALTLRYSTACGAMHDYCEDCADFARREGMNPVRLP